MTAPLCFIDTETDGVHPGRQVYEVAMIRREYNENLVRTFFVELDLSTSDPFGLNVGRFYERHPQGRYVSGAIDDQPVSRCEGGDFLDPLGAAYEVARMTHGAHLVGAVPNFDADVLDRLLRAHRLIPAWHYHLCDVEAMAVGWMHGQGWGRCSCGAEAAGEVGHPTEADCKKFYPTPELPWKSEELSRACGVEPPSDEERHTALGDAKWAMRWYDAITGGGS